MKKIIFSIFIFSVTFISLSIAQRGVPLSVVNFVLSPVSAEYPDSFGLASMEIKSFPNFTVVELRVRISNLYQKSDKIFNLWLTDSDSPSLEKNVNFFNFGPFSTKNGYKQLNLAAMFTDFKIYKTLIVTEQKFDATDPKPGKIIMIGKFSTGEQIIVPQQILPEKAKPESKEPVITVTDLYFPENFTENIFTVSFIVNNEGIINIRVNASINGPEEWRYIPPAVSYISPQNTSARITFAVIANNQSGVVSVNLDSPFSMSIANISKTDSKLTLLKAREEIKLPILTISGDILLIVVVSAVLLILFLYFYSKQPYDRQRPEYFQSSRISRALEI